MEDSQRSYTIYCLRLEHGCYYVGRTTNLEKRLQEHSAGNGSAWTKLHPMICLETKKDNCDVYDEDKYVKKTMQQAGIDKVRGGSYSQVKLTDEQLMVLQQEFRTVGDRCFKCGQSGHYANACLAARDYRHKVRAPPPKEDHTSSQDEPSTMIAMAKTFGNMVRKYVVSQL